MRFRNFLSFNFESPSWVVGLEDCYYCTWAVKDRVVTFISKWWMGTLSPFHILWVGRSVDPPLLLYCSLPDTLKHMNHSNTMDIHESTPKAMLTILFCYLHSPINHVCRVGLGIVACGHSYLYLCRDCVCARLYNTSS